MKTKESIKIDFNNAMKQAASVDTCAEELRKVGRQLQEVINELGSGWKGEAASLYLQKCETLSSKINKSANDLSKISSTISKTAKVYYETEKAALEIVKQKSI
ncbi:MAG: WXG100 family type VII secretion target [Oliverpabstia sp.]